MTFGSSSSSARAHVLQFVNTVLASLNAKLRLPVVFSVQSVMLFWPPALWCKFYFL